MDKQFEFEVGTRPQVGDLRFRQFAREDGTAVAERLQQRQPRLRLDRHLGRCVAGQVGRALLCQRCKPEILQNKHVCAQSANVPDDIFRLRQLCVGNERIERDMHPDAVQAAIAYRGFERGVVKVVRAAAGVELFGTEVDRVRAGTHGSRNGGRRTGRRQKFRLRFHQTPEI